MAEITIEQFQPFPAAQGYATTGTYVRGWYSRSYQDSDGVEVQGGNGATGFYINVQCTVTDGTITVPDLTVRTTVDANDATPQSIQFFLRLFSNGTPKDWLTGTGGTPQGWVVYNPDPLTTWTFAQLQLLNQTSYLANPPLTYPTTQEMIDYVNSIQYANASVLTKGITYLDVNPDVPTHPTAVGANSYATTTHRGIVKTSVTPAVANSPTAVITDDPRVLEEISLSRYATLALAVTAAGTTKQLVIDTTTAPSANLNLTNTVLRFVNGGAINPTAGITITLGYFTAPAVQIFGGAGSIIFSSKCSTIFYPEWWGALGDGSTNDTAAITAAITSIDNSGNLDSTLQFLARTYIISGPLLDTGNSNAQIILPRRNSTTTYLSLRWRGAAPAPTMATGNGGTIIKSTLASGTGAILGVKNPTSTGIANITYLTLTLEDITFRTIDNPTISALDLSYIPNLTLRNVKVDVAYTGSITLPTTATSYGIKTPLNNAPDVAIMENVQSQGFYNGVLVGELTDIKTLTIDHCVYAVEIREAYHRSTIRRLVVTDCIHTFNVTGTSQCYVDVDDVSIEHDTGTFANVDDVIDSNNYWNGTLNWHIVVQNQPPGPGSTTLLGVVGAANLLTHQIDHNQNYDSRYTEAFSGYSNAVGLAFELNRHLATSTDTLFPVLALTTEQSGTSNAIGQILALNSAIVATEKRIGAIAFQTSGATNSGRVDIGVANAGTLGMQVSIRPTSVKIVGVGLLTANPATLATTTPLDLGASLLTSNVLNYTPTQDSTLNLASVPTCQEFTIVITTSGASSFTITFGTNFKTVGTLATGVTTAKVFTISFVCNGTICAETCRTTAM